ncbi:hypothetical protein [Streptomyces sp. NEAU-174]|uniref:hypothetical protein n=1 Tax=Streptomyces sp. NEAU-174 TaxID=3458254 RepID=UPI004043A33B
MTEKMKPPARRPKTSGRVLGGAAKKTASPPPPPTAELTPEQFAAERASAQSKGHPAVTEPQTFQPAPSATPVEESAKDRGAVPEAPQASAQPSDEVVQSSPAQAPAASQLAGPGVAAPAERLESAQEPMKEQMQAQRAVPAPAPAASAVQPTQSAERVSQSEPSQNTATAAGTGQAAEVAVRSTVPPAPGGIAFPVKTEVPGSRPEQDVPSETAPNEGTPWTQGSGRPADIPEAAVVLNQRIIARESLDSSVPAALKLKKRIKRFALDNELDHLPVGDIVSVALDEWLTTRGF